MYVCGTDSGGACLTHFMDSSRSSTRPHTPLARQAANEADAHVIYFNNIQTLPYSSRASGSDSRSSSEYAVLVAMRAPPLDQTMSDDRRGSCARHCVRMCMYVSVRTLHTVGREHSALAYSMCVLFLLREAVFARRDVCMRLAVNWTCACRRSRHYYFLSATLLARRHARVCVCVHNV